MNFLDEFDPGLSGLELAQRMLATGRRPGMAETLDIRLVEVGDGHAVFEATPGEHHYNPMGVVHGGFAATILDFACGYATLSKMQNGQRFSTLELKVAYHKAITKDTGPVRAEGKVVSIGRRAAFTEARLYDMAGKLYASTTSTLLVMSPTTDGEPK